MRTSRVRDVRGALSPKNYHSSDAQEYIRLAKEAGNKKNYGTMERLLRVACEAENTWTAEEGGGRRLLRVPDKGLFSDFLSGLASRDAAAYIAKASRTAEMHEKERIWRLYVHANKTYRKEHPCRVIARGTAA